MKSKPVNFARQLGRWPNLLLLLIGSCAFSGCASSRYSANNGIDPEDFQNVSNSAVMMVCRKAYSCKDSFSELDFSKAFGTHPKECQMINLAQIDEIQRAYGEQRIDFFLNRITECTGNWLVLSCKEFAERKLRNSSFIACENTVIGKMKMGQKCKHSWECESGQCTWDMSKDSHYGTCSNAMELD